MDHVGHGSSQLLCVKLALDQATLALADLFVRKHASLGSGARVAVKDALEKQTSSSTHLRGVEFLNDHATMRDHLDVSSV